MFVLRDLPGLLNRQTTRQRHPPRTRAIEHLLHVASNPIGRIIAIRRTKEIATITAIKDKQSLAGAIVAFKILRTEPLHPQGLPLAKQETVHRRTLEITRCQKDLTASRCFRNRHRGAMPGKVKHHEIVFGGLIENNVIKGGTNGRRGRVRTQQEVTVLVGETE